MVEPHLPINNMTKYVLLMLTLTVFGCTANNNKQKNSDCLAAFKSEITLNDGLVLIDSILYEPTNIAMFDSLVVYSTPNTEAHLTLQNHKTKNSCTWLKVGRAGNEIVNFMGMTKYNDSIIQVNAAPSDLLYYNVKDIIKGNTNPLEVVKFEHQPFSTAIRLNDTMICFQGLNIENTTANTRYCTKDIKNGVTKYWGEYPSGDTEFDKIPSNDFSRLTAYQNCMIYNHHKGLAVSYFYMAVGFEIVNPKQNEIIMSRFYQYPMVDIEYISQFNLNFVRTKPESKRGFLDAAIIDSSIYFLYSDKTFGNKDSRQGRYILRYDWEGNPIRKYLLPYDVTSFTVAGDNIIVSAYDEQNDLYSIVSFSLNV